MITSLFDKPNEERVELYYPTHGKLNVLRKVKGVKVKSYVGPNGNGITVQEDNGNYRCLTLKKCVIF